MSDASKAVFLSYASQDAEAAKQIAGALRAAGVEVWFDQSELVGGDAWDQKIRRQIKDCALLIPIISENTQMRTEGYFRLEWRLADQRTHLMAKGRAFLLPVVIDGTTDADAAVPDSFLDVQWTRLRPSGHGGQASPEDGDRALARLVARVGDILNADPAARQKEPRFQQQWSQHPLPAAPAGPRWMRPLLATAAIVSAVLAATLFMRRGPGAPVAAPTSTPVPAAGPAPTSAARELIAKVYPLLRGLDASREDFALVEEYCQRALKLDPDDGEVWAAYSQLNAAFGYRGWDTSPERREQTRVMAERAMRLAPRSVESRIALAGSWAVFGINRDEREKLLREIVRDEPGNQGALRFLAVTVLSKPGGLAETLALNERSAALPGGDPLALFNNARYLWNANRPAEGYAMLQRAIGQKPFTSALVLKMAMEVNWRGDLAAADATLREIPAPALQEDRANYTAGLLRYTQRDAAGALEIWRAFPRTFYSDFIYDGPKGLLLGLAYELDQRDAAARIEWRTALQAVEKKIAATPNKAGPYYAQAYLHACLGDREGGNEALRTYEQLAEIKLQPGEPMTLPLARVYARLGRFDEIFAHLPVEKAILRISPQFDTLRADPRFPQLVGPAGGQQTEDAGPGTVPAVDQKSVAVLAFANLSDEKDNEYFSDGISEELLNVLAKVPGLKVSARTSAFYFKGREVPIPEIAQQLGVAYVVEGSVRKQGSRVRITAQLIKAADGFHVWSDTFTRDVKDTFAVQDEIAALIAHNISPVLDPPRSPNDRALAPEAIQEYLVGRAAAAKAGMADLQESVAHFARAVEIEPRFTAAWVQLATAHTQLGRWGGARPSVAWPAARAAIDRAKALESDSPDVLLAEGWILRTAEWKWREAEQAFRRALALRPNHPETLSGAAVLLFNLGQDDEAFRLGRQAVQLDPLNPGAQVDLSIMYYESGRIAEAEQTARRALQLAPNGGSFHAILTWSLIAQHRYAEAEAEIAQETDDVERPTATGVLALARGDPAGARAMIAQLETLYRARGDTADLQGNIAWLATGLGDTERAFAALEKARASRDPCMSWLRTSPYYAPLHSDSRWTRLIHEVGLADEQLGK